MKTLHLIAQITSDTKYMQHTSQKKQAAGNTGNKGNKGYTIVRNTDFVPELKIS